MIRSCRTLCVSGGLCALSCSTTEYNLYSEEADMNLDQEGGATFVGSGGTPSSSGGVGQAGADEVPDCNHDALGPKPVRIYSSQLNLCLSRGVAQSLMGNPGFVVDLVPCDDAVERLWTVSQDDAQALRFENVSSGFNLDVRFADSEAGTPFVLYGAHGLYNQRYLSLPLDDGRIQLSPRHARNMCAEARSLGVELQPCDETQPAQFFKLIECGAPL